MEVWKDIKGSEGRYQISNKGRVKSLERKVNNHTGKLTVRYELKCGYGTGAMPLTSRIR